MELLWAILIILGASLLWGFIKGYRGPSSDPVGRIRGPGTYQMEVVGESHYQSALERACGGRTEDGVEKYIDATLILEDSNPHDPMAVQVAIDGRTVGYLSRETARQYRKQLKEANHPRLAGVCSAVIRGGWDRGADDRGSFGIWLDLPDLD